MSFQDPCVKENLHVVYITKEYIFYVYYAFLRFLLTKSTKEMVINELKYMTYGLVFVVVVKISITIDENKIM